MTLIITTDRAARRTVSFETESEFVRSMLRRLNTEWPIRASAVEVRSHGRCRADVCVRIRDVYAPLGSDLVVSIEAKLSDWQRALRQAVLNQCAVDASFVAMPISRINDSLLDHAQNRGVGILALCGRRLNIVLPAAVSSPDSVLRRRVEVQLIPTKARGRTYVRDIVMGV
jgi:hypothetical protein